MFPTRRSLVLWLSSSPFVTALTSSLTRVSSFGTNPTNVTMYIYVPTTVVANPPILVNPHWCHGDAAAAFAGSQYATLADTYGFIVIYPDSPNAADKCWDVSSTQSLTHNGGGDALGIVSMVKYALATYGGDADRVFATGTSSGAMMTNVLLGSYPDVFAAGSAWAGVAFGCFAGNGYDVWSGDCATGLVVKTGAEWKALVDAAYPGYTGFRPKMQVFHGALDTVLYPQNLQEEIKQWTAVLGLPSTPVSTLADTPLPGWTKSVYGSSFEAYSAAGVTHDIQTQYDTVMAWLDLRCTTGNCYSRTNTPGGSGTSTTLKTSTTAVKSTTTSKATTTTTAATTATTTRAVTTTTSKTSAAATTTAVAGTVPKYGQCGGIGYTGPTTCAADAGICHYSNDWYSQCY